MDPNHIAILAHEGDRLFERTNYLIHPLAQLWRRKGLPVDVLRGTGPFLPARLVFPHIDLTVRPPEYEALLRRHRFVVNRRVLDVSKSTFSEVRVRRDSPDTGPVIVKTNRNHGGLPERRLSAPPVRRALGQRVSNPLRRVLRTPVEWERIQWLDTESYRIFAALRDVPDGVFENDNLLVERFVPEKEGRRYAIRYGYVLGSREITLRLVSQDPIIKGGNAERCDEVESPLGLAQLRRRIGLDYGKVDFVLHGGRFIPLDINPTPAAATLEEHGFLERVSSHLAEGIGDLLGRLAPLSSRA